MKKVDHTGKVYGKLTVLSESLLTSSWGRPLWKCLCSCGNVSHVPARALSSGSTKSCGCGIVESHTTHGMRKLPEYEVWSSMKDRCYNPNDSKFKDYGGRGITVCPEWKSSFENFIRDMGRRPSAFYSIERKNNDGGYSRNNCVWATALQQQNNRRVTPEDKRTQY